MQDEDPRKLSSWAATLIISQLCISLSGVLSSNTFTGYTLCIHWVYFTHSLGTLLTFIGYTTSDE